MFQITLQYKLNNKTKFCHLRQIKQMEVNCCLFPAPSNFDFNRVIEKILLVPTANDNRTCLFYHQKYLPEYYSPELNDFTIFLEKRNKVKKRFTNSRIETGGDQVNDISINNQTMKSMVQTNNTTLEQIKKNNKSYSMVLGMKNQKTGEIIKKVQNQIPCLFLMGGRTDKIVLMFHGNGEDISSSYQFASYINDELNVSVLLMEYRGYSVYKGSPSPANIIEDARRVISFLEQNGIQSNQIILFGRSIGGGIAFELASQLEPAALILLSPFLSLKKIAYDLYGSGASCLLKQTLNNQNAADKVQCPILLIHGLKDTLVPYQHSVGIINLCKTFTRLKLADNMTHTKFNFRSDFLIPVQQFLYDLQILTKK